MTTNETDGAVLLGIRHGAVENHTGGYYGHLPGFGLSALGRAQAEEVGQDLSDFQVAAIYASPLDRAMETANIIGTAVGAKVAVDERLIEWRFWEAFQGRKGSDALRSEIREIRKGLLANPNDESYGESVNGLRARLASWVEEVSRSYPSGLVVGVAHFDTLRVLITQLLGWDPDRFWDISVGHCQVVRLHPHPLREPYDPSSIREILEDANVP